jgi:hypothetical protein
VYAQSFDNPARGTDFPPKVSIMWTGRFWTATSKGNPKVRWIKTPVKLSLTTIIKYTGRRSLQRFCNGVPHQRIWREVDCRHLVNQNLRFLQPETAPFPKVNLMNSHSSAPAVRFYIESTSALKLDGELANERDSWQNRRDNRRGSR